MIASAVAFALGAIALQSSAELPSERCAGAILALGLIGWLMRRAIKDAVARRRINRRRVPLFLQLLMTASAGFAIGYGWSAWRAIERFSRWLDPQLESIEVQLEGTIVDLPQPFDGGVRFSFDVERSTPYSQDAASPSERLKAASEVRGLVLLTWYEGGGAEEFQYVRPLRGGERWRFTTRIRRPHGNANPLVFDYEAALLERGVIAMGTVRNEPAPERLSALGLSVSGGLARIREDIRDRLWEALEQAPYRGIVVALAIGDQQAISNELWMEFNRTGISHLMSISGLHITMFGALAATAAGFCWRRVRNLPLIMPAQKVAAIAGLAGATVYCALAGFGVPAQRTLYMLGVAALALLFDRWHSAASVLAAALVVVIAIDPWAPLTAGFWLSFCAVAVLFYGAGGSAQGSQLREWVRAQGAVTVGLAPLTLAIFKQVSLVGPLVNAIAIPLVSLVITPLSLVAAVAPYAVFARLAHGLLSVFMPWLHKAAAWPYAVWAQHSPPLWTLAMAALGVCWVLAPRGIPGRGVGFAMMVPMLFVTPQRPSAGEAWLDVLDVGQGLAVVIRTRAHTIVYDPGPRYGPDADAGDRVVVPYLQANGVRDIDRLIVTHQDADHSGGTRSVLRALPTALMQSSLDERHLAGLEAAVKIPCYAGQRWQDDGVDFAFIHPDISDYQQTGKHTNSMSCVLRVATKRCIVLLTSDIEAKEERRLVSRYGSFLHADLLLVPHHGSRTSSSPAFLETVRPRLAVVSAGYHNRFGHPRADILERYRALAIPVLRTDRGGAITVEMSTDSLAVHEFRRFEPRYYRHVPD